MVGVTGLGEGDAPLRKEPLSSMTQALVPLVPNVERNTELQKHVYFVTFNAYIRCRPIYLLAGARGKYTDIDFFFF